MSDRLASQFIRATQTAPHPPSLASKRRHSESDHDEYRDQDRDRDRDRDRFLPGGYLATYDDKTIDYIARRNLDDDEDLAGKVRMRQNSVLQKIQMTTKLGSNFGSRIRIVHYSGLDHELRTCLLNLAHLKVIV